jgi:hypothetical protein
MESLIVGGCTVAVLLCAHHVACYPANFIFLLLPSIYEHVVADMTTKKTCNQILCSWITMLKTQLQKKKPCY